MGLSFILTLSVECYWWSEGLVSVTGAERPEARVAEIAYLTQMATSWWTTRRLMQARGYVIRTILADKRFLKSSSSYIRCTWAAVVAYVGVTTYLYAKIVGHGKDLSSPFSIPVLLLAWLYTFPFAASVLVFAVACLHVRDQVLYFAQASDCTGLEDLRAHFEFVCRKLERLGGFFGPYLTVCHVCGMTKLAAVVVLWESGNSIIAWINCLLAARVLGILLIVDIIGAQVSSSTQHIQRHIVEWQHFSTAPDLMRKDCVDQLLLVQHSAMLEQRNYHSLQVFSFNLTPENCLRATYLLAASVFYSINYASI